ncbi:MAG: leucine-rich repeat protein [Bacteroidota bacterium]|nr:leucine-rich repeat protein [Bacteroidota bacterium]
MARHAHRRLASFGSLVSFLFLLLPGLVLAQAPERAPSKETEFKKMGTRGWDMNPTRAVPHRDDMIRDERFRIKSEAHGRFQDRLRPERPVTEVSAIKQVAHVSVTICDRTAAVIDAILSRISGASNCSEVTSTQLAAITSLNLRSRNISSLNEGDFDGLISLTGLDLGRNDLSTLPDGIFDQLTSLTELFLSYNDDLVTLPDGIFDQLTSLTDLSLSGNDLVTLPDGIFDQLTSLTGLWLSDNDLVTLPDGIFDQLTSLNVLDLDDNNLVTLPDGIFDQLTSLTVLDLKSNNLVTLPDGIFDQLISLTWLYLDENALRTFPDGIFDQLTSLTRLDLLNNDLVTLPDGIFDQLISLTRLDLKYNKLVTLPDGIFKNLTQLPLEDNNDPSKGLYLRYNPGAPFRPVVNAGADLTVQSGATVSIPGSVTGPWGDFVRWEWIQVDGPDSDTPMSGALPLTGGDTATPSFAAPMAEGDLHFRLVATPGHEGAPTESRGHANSDPDWVTVRVVTVTNTCDRTAAVIDAILSRVSGTSNCSEVTSTQLAAITGTLDLRSRNISSLKKGDFDGLISLTGLDLSGNAFSTLPDGIFDLLTSLTRLDLSGNALSTLPGDIFDQLTSLTWLSLRGNALSKLPDDIFKNLTQLPLEDSNDPSEGLSLQDNPGAPFRPVVNAGADLTVQPGGRASIPGIVTGPWGDFVRWEWVQVDGPDSDTPTSGALPLTGGDTAAPSFAAPMAEGDLYFRLVAAPGHEGEPTESLGQANSDPDWVTVTVRVGICDRTAAVIGAILNRISGASICSEVTSTQLAAITGLGLGRRNFLSLKEGDFDGLTSLTLLSLSGNGLVTLPAGIFDQLTSLTELLLYNNDLVMLPDGIFDQLNSLTELYLFFNDLVTLPAGIFDQLNSLTLLDLRHNDLATLPDGIFDQLTSLTDLTLSGNDLVTLPDGIFDQLNSLTWLSLSGNDLVTLPDGIFDQLTSLTGLDLWDNDLVTLPDGIFDQLTSLTLLGLMHNDLATLSAGIFDQLTSLTWLGLSGNAFSTLPDGIFDQLTLLTQLYLGENDLVTLPDGIFDQLTLLTELNLGDNDLVTLPDGIFENLTQLPLGWSISSSIGLFLHDNPGAPFRPVVNAGADLMVQPGATVSIPGSVSGPWGDFVRWEWIQVDGLDSDIPISEALLLTGGDTATPSFAAPMVEGDLHFRLVATPGHEEVPTESLGHANSDPDWVTVRVATATNTTEHPSVVDFALLGNYPNPFNPSTTILLDVPQVAAVSVEVFNVLGQRVHREDFPVVAAGPSKPLLLNVSRLSSGTYVYQVTARMGKKVHRAGGRMTLVK